MQLNKKTIITNTILFAGIVGFILAFSGVFGDENILIGVSTIAAMLMLLERDLTSHPVGNTVKFVLLNLFIGVGAFLAGFNTWLAVPINFIVMFVVSYSLLFNLKNPLYFPFSLQYLFILATPVAIDQMPLRLASLVFGALAIMGLQMLANRNKITKSGDKMIQAVCTALVEKSELIKKGENLETINQQITTDISGLRNIIYDKREENYYLTEEGQLKLNVSASLEKINILLDKILNEGAQQEILDNVIHCLQFAADSSTNGEAMEKLEESFNQMLGKYKDEHTHSLLVLRVLNNINFLKVSLAELKALSKEHYNVVKNLERIPKQFQKMRIGEKKSHTNSIKMSYAVRMAVAISLSGFIVDFFEITEGRWMMFSVLSVIIPLYEQSTKKMRDRIFATVIGAVLVTVLFMIFQGNIARSILLMTSGYLMTYIKVYRYNTILVTFSAIGAAALITGTTEILTVNRIGLVVAGVILALLINKFILPYKLDDAKRNLKEMYNDTIHEMLIEAADQVKGNGNNHAMKNLLLISNLIEDRLKLNNQGTENEKGIAWLQHQRRAASTIYELYWWIYKYGIQESNAPAVSSRLELLLNSSTTEEILLESVTDMKELIKTMPRIEDRMVISMILEVMEEITSSKAIV
ncbi:FUSC family protein [Sporosarcina sp. E16_3]|uniref:FUSC family protein n=1 Tax=Sporosarcina sp. E16_3 TaxID=2789293 RepID=UPI001A92164A|nr:FUSC family protein [Sporosarcina sp. E16_3]MBO0603382.1 FUSC family protein [Sporosarcina sp. E16_3]